MDRVIEIDLDSKYEYVNEYDDNRINESLNQYILDNLDGTDEKILMKVKFNYDAMISLDSEVEEKFKNSFLIKLDIINRKITKQNSRDMFLLFLGFLFLVIYCYLDDFNIFLVAEFFMVISWVAFWEFAESLLFERRRLILERKKYKKLLNARYEVDKLIKEY